MACVTRGWKPDVAELYPLPLAEPLPAIRIPLRESDADVTLNLQALIDQCYENGGYDTIDYRQPPVPPLGPRRRGLGRKVAPRQGRASVVIADFVRYRLAVIEPQRRRPWKFPSKRCRISKLPFKACQVL